MLYVNNTCGITRSFLPENQFEIVERKFRGHPDSLADLIAQEFIKEYVDQCQMICPELGNRYFGNLSSDKVTLIGGTTRIKGRDWELEKPVDALLIGKITERIGDKTIPVDKIFRESVDCIFKKCLKGVSMNDSIRFHHFPIVQAGVDHNENYYQPESAEQLIEMVKGEYYANDTAFVVSFAPYSAAENLAIQCEQLTLSERFQKEFEGIGTDIKIMIKRVEKAYDVTMCLPVLPDFSEHYDALINNVKDFLTDSIVEKLNVLDPSFDDRKLCVQINTKDRDGKKYIAVWGTSLSKGDCGCVGRGNRAQGFTSGFRPSTNEAFSGKSPNNFAGCIYQMIGDSVSSEIFNRYHARNAVVISSNNGDILKDPSCIHVSVDSSVSKSKIQNIVFESLERIDDLRQEYLERDVVASFLYPKNAYF